LNVSLERIAQRIAILLLYAPWVNYIFYDLFVCDLILLLGYKASEEGNLTLDELRSFNSACESCSAGQYGNDPERLECYNCEAGYVCLGSTTSQYPTNEDEENGYKCPEGSYCPQSSSIETPCPAGRYSPNEGAQNISDCLFCDKDTYQHQTGQASCLYCSSSSYSDVGESSCHCIGLNRAFQPTGETSIFFTVFYFLLTFRWVLYL